MSAEGFFTKKRNFCLIFAALESTIRDVAQPGSALAWGARGRKFESCRPDHKVKASAKAGAFAFWGPAREQLGTKHTAHLSGSR